MDSQLNILKSKVGLQREKNRHKHWLAMKCTSSFPLVRTLIYLTRKLTKCVLGNLVRIDNHASLHR